MPKAGGGLLTKPFTGSQEGTSYAAALVCLCDRQAAQVAALPSPQRRKGWRQQCLRGRKGNCNYPNNIPRGRIGSHQAMVTARALPSPLRLSAREAWLYDGLLPRGAALQQCPEIACALLNNTG